MTGFGATMNFGGYELGMINYSKPPQRKKKVFFGNDSAGPYQIGATGVIPGSEKVRAGGASLSRTAGYSIDYNKGEITFDSPVALSDKIVIEYELTQSGGGAPGKFMGFRFQTKKDDEKNKVEVENKNKDNDGNPVADQGASGNAGNDQGTDTSSTAPQRNKKFSLAQWGVSYFKDQVIDYKLDGAN